MEEIYLLYFLYFNKDSMQFEDFNLNIFKKIDIFTLRTK